MRTRHAWLVALAVVPAALAGHARPAAAATLAVPAGYATIQAALAAALPGDTVTVAPGTYHENVDLGGKAVTLAATGGPTVTVIDGVGGTTVTMGPGGAVTGFTVTGGSADFGAGLRVTGAGAVIRGNVFTGNTQGAGGSGAAIYGNNASPLVDANVFTANTCDAQFTSGVVAFLNSSEPTVTNNVFHDNACRAINLSQPAAPSVLVINNTIVRNAGGIYVDGRVDASRKVLRNNIVADNEVGIEAAFGNPPTVESNLVSGNGVDYRGLPDQGGLRGNLSADPRFVDTANDDFHLADGSPAAGAGSPIGAPATDHDGLTRTAPVDIGAYRSTMPAPVVPETPWPVVLPLTALGALALGLAAANRRRLAA